jgi:hypothetical protein
MNHIMRVIMLISVLFSAVALEGCNGVPFSTQWKLRGFDLGTADVTQLRVALRAPDWATLTPEKTILVAKYAFEDGSSGRKLEIHLHSAEHARDRDALARFAAQSSMLVVYEVAPRDVAAVRAFQAETQSAKAAGHHGKAEIELGGDLACRKDEIPEGPVTLDAYLHASDEIGWLPLLEKFDVKPQLSRTKSWDEIVRSVSRCDKHAKRVEAVQ